MSPPGLVPRRLGRYRYMVTVESTRSGWRYWIEPHTSSRSEDSETVLGALRLRPVEGEDIAFELCPGYTVGEAPQNDLRRKIREVVGDAVESQEIFDFTAFMLPDLIEARVTRARHVA